MYDRTKILDNLYYIPDAGNYDKAFDGEYIYHAIPQDELQEALQGYLNGLEGLYGLGTLDGWFRRLRKKIKRGFKRVGRKVKKGFKKFGRKFKKVAKKVGKAIYKGVRVALPIAAVAANFIPIPGVAQAVSVGLAVASAGIEAYEAHKRKKAEKKAEEKARKQAIAEEKRMQLEDEKMRKLAEKQRKQDKEDIRKEILKSLPKGSTVKSVTKLTPKGRSKTIHKINKKLKTVTVAIPKKIQKRPTIKQQAVSNFAQAQLPFVQQQIAQQQIAQQQMAQQQIAQQQIAQRQYLAMQPLVQAQQAQQMSNFIQAQQSNNNKMSDIANLSRLTMQAQTADIINAIN